jgi:catechol 2,3-dioxygenase-like lactoylglutathione lyase family enzyme
MLDHVTANVGDIEQAKRFYSQALAPLGYSLAMEFEGGAGFGTGEGMADFWLGSSSERGATHVAFVAPERAAVDAFYELRWRPAGRTTALPGSARITTKTSTRRTCTIRTATTSRR